MYIPVEVVFDDDYVSLLMYIQRASTNRAQLTLCNIFGNDFTTRQLNLWAKHRYCEDNADSDGDLDTDNLFGSHSIDDLGNWSDSPQGHKFWSKVEAVVGMYHDGRTHTSSYSDKIEQVWRDAL